LFDGETGPQIETIKYAPRTGPSTKERVKGFLELDILRGRASVREIANDDPSSTGQRNDEEQQHGMIETQGEEDAETPQLSLLMTIGLLVVITVLVAVTAAWLVDSINGLASGGGISKQFIGLILIPIVGNAAEHVTAVTVSIKGKLTLGIGIAVGSAIVSFLPPFPAQRN
jgi:Ca2+:H+ antiporter